MVLYCFMSLICFAVFCIYIIQPVEYILQYNCTRKRHVRNKNDFPMVYIKMIFCVSQILYNNISRTDIPNTKYKYDEG